MAQRIAIVAGPARAGKTTRLVEAYRRAIAAAAPASVLWLAPNYRSAADVRARILSAELGGCLGPGVMTFDQFGRAVLAAAPLVMRPLDAVAQRDLLKRLVDEARAAGELEYFGPIADTAGFLELVAGFIRELKRLEVWPHELAKACGRRPTAKEHELCRLYERYQQLLTAHQLYDAQGTFWAARAALRDGSSRAFSKLRQVFVDGFTDFTRTEHEILEILAERADQITVSLALDADETEPARRGDLFAKCRMTLTELRKRHRAVDVEWLAQRASGWPAMDHLERYVFANPRDVPRPRDAAGLEILAASGVRAEIELLAQRIKDLLAPAATTAVAVRPHDVLVIFRTIADVRDLVVEIFGEYGIPLAIEGSEPLARAPVLAALAAWLRLDRDDWPFHALAALVVHNHFRPDWPEWNDGRGGQAAEWLIRRLQVPAGRAALLAQAERLANAARERSADEEPSAIEREASLAWPLLARLAATLDQLPRRATPRGWVGALTKFATSTGLLVSSGDADSGAANALDRLAWQQWTAALLSAERLDRWLDRPPRELDRSELVDYLTQVMRQPALATPPDECGRVRVLAAETARGISAPYVFLAGLSERSFPAQIREDCLLGEGQVRHLAEEGLPLVPRQLRSGYEMLLFYEVATRATKQLTLSYPALDPAGQPLTASPYVTEIERSFNPLAISRYDEQQLTSVPASDDVLSPREFRLRAVAQAAGGDHRLLIAAHSDASLARVAPNIVAALAASTSRHAAEFGSYEGLLTSANAQRVLAERYGSSHVWSPSQLEQYAICPFQFFAERVLKLAPLDDPVLTTDYAGRGRMLHALLSELHRGLNERAASLVTPSDLDEEAFAAGMAALVADLVARLRADRPLADGLLEIDARRLADWLARYRQQHVKYDARASVCDAPPRPAHFEISFGRAAAADDALDRDDPLSSPEPLVLRCGSESIQFAGRIDRIDIGKLGGRVVFNVVDYKSSARPPKLHAKDELYALQLPLYALAAEQLLAHQQAMPLHASYWHVAGRGAAEPIEFAALHEGELRVSDEWIVLGERLRRRVASLVADVRQGKFPVYSADEACTSRCDYRTICRVNQARALEKPWPPQAEAPS